MEVTLNHDRWVEMFHTAANDYSSALYFAKVADSLVERFKEAVPVLVDAMNTFMDGLREAFKTAWDAIYPVIKDYIQQSPQSFQQRPKIPRAPKRTQYRLNTKGYPQRPMQCARSRC